MKTRLRSLAVSSFCKDVSCNSPNSTHLKATLQQFRELFNHLPFLDTSSSRTFTLAASNREHLEFQDRISKWTTLKLLLFSRSPSIPPLKQFSPHNHPLNRFKKNLPLSTLFTAPSCPSTALFHLRLYLLTPNAPPKSPSYESLAMPTFAKATILLRSNTTR